MRSAAADPGKPMFDEKIAQSTQITYYDDDAKKAQWVKTVRNYLIGCSWEMRQLLLRAESFQKRIITLMDIQNLGIANTYMEDIGFGRLIAASQRPHGYHLRIIKHTKHHASCCIASSCLAHRGNRKSGQATRDNDNEGIVYLSVVNPFLGRKSKLS